MKESRNTRAAAPFLIAALLLGSSLAQAAQVRLRWDPVTKRADGTALAGPSGYRLFVATTSFSREGNFISTLAAQADSLVRTTTLPGAVTSHSLDLDLDTTYYFRLTALASQSQSRFNLDSSGLEVELSTFIASPGNPGPRPRTSTETVVRLLLDPGQPSAVPGPSLALVTVKTNDPAFPSEPTLAVRLAMPSGSKTLTLTRMSPSPLRYFSRLERGDFAYADFHRLENHRVEVAVGTRTFVARGRQGEIDPELGGRVEEENGAAHVTIMPGSVSQEARLAISPEPADPANRRQGALARQNLLSLGAGREITLTSSGTLRSATLVLPFDPALIPAGNPASRLGISHFNPASGAWETVRGVSVVGNTLQAQITHFSLYKPTMFLPNSLPGLRDSYVYPNPAVGRDPVIRAAVGVVDSLEITIFDISGQVIHSGTLGPSPAGISGGEYYYDYAWTGRKATGIYVAVINGKKADGSTVRARTKFAVIR